MLIKKMSFTSVGSSGPSCTVREMGSSNAMPKRPACDQAVPAAAVELFQSCEPADVHVVNSKTLCAHEQCDSSHDG